MTPTSPDSPPQSIEPVSSDPSDREMIAACQLANTKVDRRSGRTKRSKRQMLFAPLGALFDAVLWVIAYLALSQVTGGYNNISTAAILLPLVVLILTLSLVGGYRRNSG